MITNLNIGNQSVNYANSAGSSTKASQDSNGKNIASTYFPYSGGTFTGPIKFNSSSLPSRNGQDYLVGIDAFDSGGTLKWCSSSNVKVGAATKADEATNEYNVIVSSSQPSDIRCKIWIKP
ncbi:MAG TPA: hypothetical protein DCW90_15640 [Lachnospiraceae bacterium]|nr:hypothetical protein [Lachnospiraceae bacterium]